jgi:hypothetical protein
MKEGEVAENQQVVVHLNHTPTIPVRYTEKGKGT